MFCFHCSEALKWNDVHNKYGSLLSSLVDVNEERMKTINRMIHLDNVNYNGLLRSILHSQPENVAVVILSEKDNAQDKSISEKSSEENFIDTRNHLRYKDSSDSDSFFHKQPTIYGPNDEIPMENARIRCVYACRNAYRSVCRRFSTECTSTMRKYFRKECRIACHRRF